jgi:hypothetical protein
MVLDIINYALDDDLFCPPSSPPPSALINLSGGKKVKMVKIGNIKRK